MPPLFYDLSQMDTAHKSLSFEPNPTTAKTMPLQPRSVNPVAQKLQIAEDQLKVEIHNDDRN